MTILDPQLFTLESEAVDQHLGLAIPEIEASLLDKARKLDPHGTHRTWGQALHQGNQTWVGLSHQTLQTPYSELKQICDELKPTRGSRFVDLGAGYGRLGLVLATFYPEVSFLGYEYVQERVAEGSRIFRTHHCQKALLLEQDLGSESFELPLAEYYFLYDYGTVSHIRRTLKQFEALADRKRFKLIARGKGVRSLIHHEHPWLADVYPAIHQEHYSIFSMSEDF